MDLNLPPETRKRLTLLYELSVATGCCSSTVKDMFQGTMSHETSLVESKLQLRDRTPYEQQCIITDLIAELAIVLNDKAKLESDNSALKIECQGLKQKLIDTERNSQDEKNSLMGNVKKSQEKIKEKEKHLAKKDAQHLEEQQKSLKEVHDLKMFYHKYKENFEERESELTSKIKLLKIKLLEANNAYDTMKGLADSNQTKYIMYKAKVKFASGVIKNLTKEINSLRQQKLAVLHKESQTETTNKRCCNQCRFLNALDSHIDINTDSKILAELFFKQHPSNDDVENIFFAMSN